MLCDIQCNMATWRLSVDRWGEAPKREISSKKDADLANFLTRTLQVQQDNYKTTFI